MKMDACSATVLVFVIALVGSRANAQYYYYPRPPPSPMYGAGAPVQGGEGGQLPGGDAADGGQGNTIGNLIVRIPQPAWISQDLTSLPNNIPRAEWTANVNANPGEEGRPDVLGSLLNSAMSGMFAGAAPPANVYEGRRFPRGDPRNCLRNNPNLNIMHVIPGLSWDNLRNVETGLISSFKYTQCKVTQDRRYIIPDEAFAIPIKESMVERNSEYINHWDSYKSVTARSINAGFDFFGRIGGKFSNEYQRIKSSQYNEKAVTMRIELRHRFYTIKLLPDFPLNPSFRARVLDIANLLLSNDSDSADFATQMLIRDYGTHYLTSIDAGAVLTQEDNLKSTVTAKYNGRANSLTAAGGADFFSMFQLGANFGTSHYSSSAELNAYRSSKTSSKVFSYGGPPFKAGMNLSDWENNLANNLVAIDRIGKPLHTAITTQNMLPELEHPADVFEVKKLIQQVISRYYSFNTHLGCTDPNAQNFDYQANAEAPGACIAGSPTYRFGGVFQTCTSNGNGICGGVVQKNPLTGGYSCPRGFTSVMLIRATATKPKTDVVCKKKKKCKLFGFIGCRKVDECNHYRSTEKATYTSFWCAPGAGVAKKGYLFGGLYSNDLQNPITRSRTCPTHYIPLKIGSHAHVCVSEDYELGQQFSLPFGGFFSCSGGNKLAANGTKAFLDSPQNWPSRCPNGFTQHLALIENSCRVNFCVKAGTLLRAQDLDIVLPPFEPKPASRANITTPDTPGAATGGITFGNALPPGFSNGLQSQGFFDVEATLNCQQDGMNEMCQKKMSMNPSVNVYFVSDSAAVVIEPLMYLLWTLVFASLCTVAV